MGLHYLANGEWVESQEVVEPTPSGAVAPYLSYRPSFAANLNTAGAIDLVLPDGQRLRSHVLGIRLRDSSTGQSQMVALVKDCIGEIVLPNEVWCRNAFEGLAGDYRCVAGKGAFEADVVLQESPLLPRGFNPDSTWLEVLTEFVDPPNPVVTPLVLDAKTAATDDDLDFGIQVEVRAANTVTQLPNQNFVTVSNNVQFSTLTGRYLEIRVTLWREPLSSAIPELNSLTVYAPY